MFGFKFDNTIDKEINNKTKYKYKTHHIEELSYIRRVDEITNFFKKHPNIEVLLIENKEETYTGNSFYYHCFIVYKEMV